MVQTIFERYGGFATLNQVVSTFYDKMLESPITSSYFANSDMRRLIDHQTKFVASVTGGPASYTDEALKRVHAPLAVTEEAFQETAKLLKETLEDFGLTETDIEHVCQEILTRKHFVVI